MNFLAHIYLSGDNKRLRIGNFMGDFVKGNNFNKYKGDVRRGVLMHRAIDDFTDNHPVTKKIRAQISVHFGLFAGIIIDMYYDYFLASNWKKYSKSSLFFYSWKFYFDTLWRVRVLPPHMRKIFFHLIVSNRLYLYRTQKGLKDSLNIMGRVIPVMPEYGDLAIQVLNDNYEEFKQAFFTFFDDAYEKFYKK